MADTAAERQRRSRAHKSGDHSLCLRERCAAGVREREPAEPVAVTPTVPPPVGVEGRGKLLWQRYLERFPQLGPGQLVILEEVARAADRCERFDAVLRGDTREWVTIVRDLRSGEPIELKIDSVVTEARLQQANLAKLITVVESMSTPAGVQQPAAPAAPEPSPAAQGKGADVASLLDYVDRTRGGSASA